MPALVALIPAVAALSGAAAFFVNLAILVASIAFNYALNMLLTPKPRNLSQEQALRIANVLDPSAPRIYVIGECRLGGSVAYRESTPDADGKKNYIFHQIIALASTSSDTYGPSTAITSVGTIYFADYPIHTSHLYIGIDPDTGLPDSDTNHLVVQQGRYGSKTENVLGNGRAFVFVEKDTGAKSASVTKFRTLSLASSAWTDGCVGNGIAKLYTQFLYGAGRFPNGIPEISARVRGLKLLDVRETGYPDSELPVFSNNPANAIAWYLTLPTSEDGCGLTTDDLDIDSFIDAANVCDEFIAVNPVVEYVDQDLELSTRKHVNVTSNYVYIRRDSANLNNPCMIQTGDRVQVAAITGALPTGLSAATDYYAVVIEYNGAPAEGGLKIDGAAGGVSDSDDYVDGNFLPTMAFCTTYAHALEQDSANFVNITAIGTGTFSITRTAEPRYTFDMVIDTSRTRLDILADMVQACSGTLIPTGGKWVLKAGAYETPAITLDEDDCIGDIDISTNIPSPEQFNQIIGQYVSPTTADNAQNYRPRNSGQGQSEDGRVIPFTMDFPATSRIQMAQRIAKIKLLDSRQPIRFSASVSLAKGLQVRGGDFIAFTNERMGWTAKVFRVLAWRFENAGSDDAPVLAVHLDCKETVEDIYDENYDANDVEDPLPGSNLPNPFIVTAPTSLAVSEEKILLNGGLVVAQVTGTWTESIDQYVIYYEFEYKLQSDTDYINIGPIYSNTVTINDIVAGDYDFRVRGVNELNRTSDWISIQQEITGLADRPSDPESLQVIALGGMAYLTWPQATDIDVIFGGHIHIRHSSSGTTWASALTIQPDTVSGDAVSAQCPLLAGYYMIKFSDSTGNESINPAIAYTAQTSTVAYTNEWTIRENSTFTGNKTYCNVNGSNELTLDTASSIVEPEGLYEFDLGEYSGAIDSRPGNVDDWADWDATGMVYLAAGGTRRVTAVREATVDSLATTIDLRTGLVDTWADWDNVSGSEADAWMEARICTEVNPFLLTATWSDWFRVDSAELFYYGLGLRAQLRSYEPQGQIEIQVLGANVDAPA